MKIEAIPTDPKRWKNNVFDRAQKGMAAAVRKQLGMAAGVVEAEVKSSLRSRMPKADELRNSYKIRGAGSRGGSTVMRRGVIDLRVTSLLPYARVQDEGSGYLPGGVIRSRTTPARKALAIPLHASLKRGGVWPRNYPSGGSALFHGDAGVSLAAGAYNQLLRLGPRSRRGNRLLVDAATGEPQYVLVPEVRVAGTKYFSAAMATAKPRLRKILGDAFHVAIGHVRTRATP